MILYLHGFRSSPDSFKARMMADAMTQRGLADAWACPQLPASPREAIALAMGIARRQLQGADSPRALTVVGSSLGGYYATWLAERLGCRAALLNPVVHAARDLATQVGEHRSYHDDQPFTFTAAHVEELRAYEVARITRPSRYYLLAATGDEVLDWREMRDHYPDARHHIIEGSDHGISDFPLYLPGILAFADAANDEFSPG